MDNLRKERRDNARAEDKKPLPNIVHNFSSYKLSEEERKALAHGLDHYIPDKIDKRKLEVEFEHLYKNILWNVENIGEEEKLNLKTKILGCYKNYGAIKTPYEHKETIKNLSKNENIYLLKQDKGRGIVIIDRTKYVEKCLDILQTDKFTELDTDPTAKFETRVQNCLRKMKKRLGLPRYNSIYTTASCPGDAFMEQRSCTNSTKAATMLTSYQLDQLYRILAPQRTRLQSTWRICLHH